MDSEPKTPDEIEIDRLLGDRALIKLDDLQPMGGPSRPTLHRAFHSGIIKIIKVGKKLGHQPSDGEANFAGGPSADRIRVRQAGQKQETRKPRSRLKPKAAQQGASNGFTSVQTAGGWEHWQSNSPEAERSPLCAPRLAFPGPTAPKR
jgi:hypothetical protein